MNYENALFLNMFPDYQPPEEVQRLLAQAVIVAADLDPTTRMVEVSIYASDYIPQRVLNQVASEIAVIYGLRKFYLFASHRAEQLHCIETEELLQMFMAENSMNRGSLAGARWEWDDQTLHIHLSQLSRQLLK